MGKSRQGQRWPAFPWGNEWEDGRCNAGNSGPVEVDRYQQGVFGAYDWVGNVPEWTCSVWGNDYQAPFEKFPRPGGNDALNASNISKEIYRVIRGGSYNSPPDRLRCSTRGRDLPSSRGNLDHQKCGFRVVQEMA